MRGSSDSGRRGAPPPALASVSTRTWTALFTATAAEQAQVVNHWWMKERPSAPDLFSDELTHAVERLTSMPGSGAVFDSTSVLGARRILLPRCGYHVYYMLDSKKREVLIRAVWHSARGNGPTLDEV